jgi:FtsP/CotA-like multicopper oxidase with cupredoxin domain
MDHPFHLHGTQFQVLDRDGKPEPFAAWKDTVNVKLNEVVRFAVRFDPYPGVRLFHCHILEHEELGMMGQVEVR